MTHRRKMPFVLFCIYVSVAVIDIEEMVCQHLYMALNSGPQVAVTHINSWSLDHGANPFLSQHIWTISLDQTYLEICCLNKLSLIMQIIALAVKIMPNKHFSQALYYKFSMKIHKVRISCLISRQYQTVRSM